MRGVPETRVLDVGHRICWAEAGTRVKRQDGGQAETQACGSATILTPGVYLLPHSFHLFPFYIFCYPPSASFPPFCSSCFIIFPSSSFHAHPTLCLVVSFSCLRFVFNALSVVTSPSHSFLSSSFSQFPTPPFSKLVPSPPSALSLFLLPVFLLP